MAMASEMRWHPDPLGMFSTKKNLHPPTSVAFPDIDILHPALLSTPPRTMCLYNYWIAYVRQVSYAKLCYAMPHHRPQGEVLEANCVKIQPAWMGEMADLLGPLQVPGAAAPETPGPQLHSLFLPGSHNAGAYNKFTSYTGAGGKGVAPIN